MIDFSKIIEPKATSNTIHPREIFMTLPNNKYGYPRDVQTEVWNKWFEKKDERNIVIKMNTGSGKSIVGLLILESSLREGKKPVIYVVQDKYLLKQIVNEARELGISITQDEDDIEFLTGKKILIVTIHKIINGKTKFGMRQGNSNIPIGTILIDDVHACLNIIESQYTLSISSDKEEYNEIYKIFEEELKRQSYSKLADLNLGTDNVTMLVPYWAWQREYQKIYELISKDINDLEIVFKLPLIKEYFHLCTCTISKEKIEIVPRSITVSNIESIRRTDRMVFMSATIANIDTLMSQFDIENVTNISPEYCNDIGERFTLFPEVVNKDILEEEIKNEIKELSQRHNTIVICPSNYRIENFWNDVADIKMDINNLEETVLRLKSEEHIGLVVMANKYEGIDLPGKACEVLVIDGLPNMKRQYDIIEQEMLYNSERILNKKIQLIEQGMGRGVRSNNDYCVVILMGKGLASTLYVENYIEKMNIATKEQIKLSNQISDQLKGKSIKDIIKSADYCLNRNEQWKKISKNVVTNLKYEQETIDIRIDRTVQKAFNLAKKGEYKDSIDVLENFISENVLESEMIGWLKMQVAEYCNYLDSVKSQEVLKSANKYNNKILKPIGGIEYDKSIKVITTQVDEIYNKFYGINQNAMIILLNKILDDLKFVLNTSNNFENAIFEIAQYIGIVSRRPEKESGIGPDNLWWIGNGNAFVIECKNGVKIGNDICKRDCNQMNGSLEWFKRIYPDSTFNAIGIIIHPSNSFERQCSPKASIRIMNKEKLDEFKVNINNFITQLLVDNNYTNKSKIEELLKYHKLESEKITNNYTVEFKVKKG